MITSRMTEDQLKALVAESVACYEAMTPEQKLEHDEAQRASGVRGMLARCKHGVLDFEQCPDCRGWRS